MLDIKITKTTNPQPKPVKGQKLGFGKIFTDHMFVMNYTEGKGWHDASAKDFASLVVNEAVKRRKDGFDDDITAVAINIIDLSAAMNCQTKCNTF